MAEPKRVPYMDHPDRCQGVLQATGDQCHFMCEPESKYCFIHAGNKANPELKALNLYRVKKYEARVRALKENNASRTIDEELAILRMVLEEVLVKTEEDGQMGLLLYSTKISELIRDIKACVVTADKLASKAGMLIGRSEAIVIAGKVVTILADEIEDQALLSRIADKVAEAFIQRPEMEEET